MRSMRNLPPLEGETARSWELPFLGAPVVEELSEIAGEKKVDDGQY